MYPRTAVATGTGPPGLWARRPSPLPGRVATCVRAALLRRRLVVSDTTRFPDAVGPAEPKTHRRPDGLSPAWRQPERSRSSATGRCRWRRQRRRRWRQRQRFWRRTDDESTASRRIVDWRPWYGGGGRARRLAPPLPAHGRTATATLRRAFGKTFRGVWTKTSPRRHRPSATVARGTKTRGFRPFRCPSPSRPFRSPLPPRHWKFRNFKRSRPYSVPRESIIYILIKYIITSGESSADDSRYWI